MGGSKTHIYHILYRRCNESGTESSRFNQASDPRRQGDSGSPCRSGSRPARRQYRSTVYADRSFSFITKTPPAAVLIKKACKLDKASGVPNKQKVAELPKEELRKIAELKMRDLNAASIEAAMSMIAGTARSMGITVEA